ncbi:hypothetical protein [Marinobacterium lutimaris]|uniref:PRTRC system protein B n=1 Tax=Marinobacterium lutimaris TaxID=568106 RepID=A0A1H6DVY3_9GAMM|nr:hypothetical protein [Marinobacterium lutimaris]SEG89421.1 PRTRC system protein B [Marinobacterium lutimaris]
MQFDSEGLSDKSIPVLPQVAFVLHGTGPRNADVMTVHDVKDGIFQIGNYVDPEAVITMIQEANSDRPDHKTRLIPENVLVDDAHYLIWFVRSTRRPFHFRHGSGDWHGQVRYPHLLFIADKHQRRLRIFALANSRRPTLEAKLYHAPLFNLNGQGDLCLGSATLPESLSVSTLPGIEAAFFDANGSHQNHQRTLSDPAEKQHKTLIGYWKSKAAADEPVRVSELNPYMTLGEVIHEL